MTVFKDVLANLGFGTSQATKDAQQNLEDAKAAYGQLSPPELTAEHPEYAAASEQGPTDLGTISVDPAYKATQMDQMAALSNLAKNGGRSAASDAELARVQAAEQQQARGAREAVLQNAATRGMGGSGASLIAQLEANQNAQNNANAQDMGVLGQEANTAINAGAGAANIAGGMRSSDYAEGYNKSAAQDAINRFNAGQNTGISQYNAGTGNAAQQFNTGLQQTGYQNRAQKAAGIAGANMAGVGFNQGQANIGAQQSGNLLSGGVQLGAAALKPKAAGTTAGGAGTAADAGSAGAGTATAGGFAGDSAVLAAARGGRIPGVAPVTGDSSLNDIVPIDASPGEVIVPRTLAKGGNTQQIGSFVKHAPKAGLSSSNKEAMLSALQNIRKKRGGF